MLLNPDPIANSSRLLAVIVETASYTGLQWSRRVIQFEGCGLGRFGGKRIFPLLENLEVQS